MANNKNALIRYKVLDKCFSNLNRRYFIEDLLRDVNGSLIEFNGSSSGINLRQLFDDIRYMESDQGWSIPLDRIRDGKRVYYRYSDPEFSITKQIISDRERSSLESALNILRHFSGIAHFEWLQEVIPGLQAKLDFESYEDEIIELQSNLDLKGISYLNDFYTAIHQKHVLEVKYRNFKSDKLECLVFHPHYLKQYNNRWFVFGCNQEKGVSNWIMALDRVEKLSFYSKDFIECTTDWKEYFFDIIGVTKPKNRLPEVIELEVLESSAPYILTKPLHPTQKVLQKNPQLRIQIEVIPNYELISTILSYGSNIRVIKPDFVRLKVAEEVLLQFKFYYPDYIVNKTET